MKIWRLNFKSDSLTLKHTRTLQLKESVLAVEFTPDSKFIAVALIDSTVKVFYRDTLKFWNSLYGHHLPVNCLATSEDSTLMVTGSADRSVKVINNKKLKSCIFFIYVIFLNEPIFRSGSRFWTSSFLYRRVFILSEHFERN